MRFDAQENSPLVVNPHLRHVKRIIKRRFVQCLERIRLIVGACASEAHSSAIDASELIPAIRK